jgi:hypothetical protein
VGHGPALKRGIMAALIRIAEGLDVAPALAELARLPDYHWILMNPDDGAFIFLLAGDHERQYCEELPEVWRLVDGVCATLAEVHGMKGNLLHPRVGRMPPGWGLTPHVDGIGGAIRRRFQLVLQSEAGVVLTAEGEARHPRPGEAWQLDASRVHSIHNGSNADRIVILFDIGL